MAQEIQRPEMEEQRVTYTLEVNGDLYIIENVPASVCVETGEQFFAPEIVEKLQSIVWEKRRPARMAEIPVYDFAA